MKYDDIKKAAIELCTTEAQEEWVKDYGNDKNMNKETIEKAAEEYIHRDKTVGMTRRKAFLDGARWRIENAWHDTTQLPHDGLLLCQDGYSVFIGGPDNQDFARNVETFHITRWAYIADLLLDRNEENL